MFVLCPHCQFLVALDPATGQAPADCPRCGNPLAPVPAVRPESTEASADGRAMRPGPQAPAVASSGHGEAVAEPAAVPAPPVPVVVEDAGAAASAAGFADTAVDDASASPPQPVAAIGPRVAEDAGDGKAVTTPIPAVADDDVHAFAATGDIASAATGATARPAPAEAADDAQALAPRLCGPAAQPVAGEAATDGLDAATDAAAADDAGKTVDDTSPTPPRRRDLPSFAHPLHATPARRAGWRSIAALAGLSLLLVLQLLLADRARLATDAHWRPLLSTLCAALQCRLPAWHEPTAFTLLARDVRPARTGVLHVSATFRNDARWPQAWPALRIALQDVDGRTVGARTLRPEEYRDDRDAHATQSGVAPGQSAQVDFDIAEPAATVVAFTFDFR